MNHTEIVKKLIGEIRPAGDSAIDETRYENLKTMCELVDNLVKEIDSVGYDYKDDHQHSVKRASEYARDFLTKQIGIV